MSSGQLLWLAIWWLVIGSAVGWLIGESKGRAGDGFLLGLFLGVLGWIIAAVLEPSPEHKVEKARELAALASVAPQPMPAVRSSAAAPPGGLRPCPWCAEDIKPAAVICRYCGRDVPPQPPPFRPESVAPQLGARSLTRLMEAANLKPGDVLVIDDRKFPIAQVVSKAGAVVVTLTDGSLRRFSQWDRVDVLVGE
jgi:uncharacterized membrane protein YeaQ/YmgE (transglycosylase-associated protein family)